jgi:hypothetical protein
MSKARLYRRSGAHAPRELIPNDQWSFDRCPDGKAKTPSNTDICFAAGFSPNYIYELTYEARDPIVMGLGFAATRDLISFLRYNRTEANPLLNRDSKPPQWAIGFGSSQSGRFLKDLIYHGFNQDESARIVFDGAIPHISASRRTFTNYEFAMPGRFSTAMEGHFTPGDEFPFTYETLTDPMTKKTDGWLLRCRQQKACPRIMHWDSGTESWQGRNSLVIGDPRGKKTCRFPTTCACITSPAPNMAPPKSPRAASANNSATRSPIKKHSAHYSLPSTHGSLREWCHRPAAFQKSLTGHLSPRSNPPKVFPIFPERATRANPTICRSTITATSRQTM